MISPPDLSDENLVALVSKSQDQESVACDSHMLPLDFNIVSIPCTLAPNHAKSLQ